MNDCKNKLKSDLEDNFQKAMDLINKNYIEPMIEDRKKEYNNAINKNKKDQTYGDKYVIKKYNKLVSMYGKESQNKKITELVNELLDTVLCNPNCKDTLYDTTISSDELPNKYLEKYKKTKGVQKEMFIKDDIKKRKEILEKNMMEDSYIVEPELLETKNSKLEKMKSKGALSNCKTKKEKEQFIEKLL